MFVEETWIKTNMAPLRGWAKKGKRLKGYAHHGHWRTMTFLAGLRTDGLSAPCVFDGPINSRCFQAWGEQQLVPKRRAARTVSELWEAIGHATDIFTPAECQNYFAAAGYDRV